MFDVDIIFALLARVRHVCVCARLHVCEYCVCKWCTLVCHHAHACVLALSIVRIRTFFVNRAKQVRHPSAWRALHGSEAFVLSLLPQVGRSAMVGEQMLQYTINMVQGQHEMIQMMAQQQWETTAASQHQQAVPIHILQNSGEPVVGGGARDSNMFLTPKTGTTPVSWAGDPTKYTGWKVKSMAHYRTIGDARVGSWVKWAHIQKKPINSDAVELDSGAGVATVN